MSDVRHDNCLDDLIKHANWQTADLRAVLFLLNGWTPGPGDAVLLDATSAGATRLAAPSYVDVVLTSNVANIDGTNHREALSTAVIDFGTLETGFDYDVCCIYRFITDDSDSKLYYTLDLGGTQTTTGVDERIVPDAAGLIVIG